MSAAQKLARWVLEYRYTWPATLLFTGLLTWIMDSDSNSAWIFISIDFLLGIGIIIPMLVADICNYILNKP